METRTQSKTNDRTRHKNPECKDVIHIRGSVSRRDDIVDAECTNEQQHRWDQVAIHIPRLIMQIQQTLQTLAIRIRNLSIFTADELVVSLPSFNVLESEQYTAEGLARMGSSLRWAGSFAIASGVVCHDERNERRRTERKGRKGKEKSRGKDRYV